MSINFKKIQKEVKLETGGVIVKPEIFKNFYIPLIKHYINDREKRKIKTYIIGIQGCQGVGKTVLTSVLKNYFKLSKYNVVGFSIDDFYKSNIDRQRLKKKHQGNPFYKISRGMPGTHRFNDLYKVLKKANSGKPFNVPCFDKSLCDGDGDVISKTINIKKPQDFIILEGWCVNIPHVKPKEFPLVLTGDKYSDKIFKELDSRKKYYKTVLNYIKKYQKIWKLLDNKTILLGKNIKWIEEWRIEQERRMIKKKKNGMSDKKIKEFIKPYIPFTYLYYDHLKKNLPASLAESRRASKEGKKDIDCLLTINKKHLPEKIEFF